MDMDHLIGQRFNLISKSEVRYLGTLLEINPEQSTITLEDVFSFGTEGRPAKDFMPASNQKFDYIVFRGSDVKDIKVAEEQKENQQPEASVPNDPAILNASRPSQPSSQDLRHRNQPPFPPPNFPQHSQHRQPPQFQNYYPQYGRGYGPPSGAFGPGPGFQGMPYGPPPPGYYGPPGQNFPPNHGPYPPTHQIPTGPSGQRPPGGPAQQFQPALLAPNELPVNDQAQETTTVRSLTPMSTVSPAPAPTPPNESKPSVSEALAPVPSTREAALPHVNTVESSTKAPPVGPKSGRIVPALPMTVNSRASAPIVPATSNGPLASGPSSAVQPAPSNAAASKSAMEEADRQARAAVANAMAKMNSNSQPATAQPRPVTDGNAIEALTKKVGEMKTTSTPRGGGRGGVRGQRGNSRGGANQNRKMEIPASDYDFESANAKFNKEDMIKEAIATGSPLGEPSEDGVVNGSVDTATNGEGRKDSLPSVTTEAYNKTSSFFDDISSEVKDREEQQMGRGRRGEEMKKNFETFGQGSVDGGFRGRGRGGFRGRGRPYGAQRGYAAYSRGGGPRGRGRGASEAV